jgi:deoxycytidylate deaminase
MNFDWGELAFGSKKPVSDLHPIFVLAPREMSCARLKQLIKTYLPQGNLLFGLAREAYVLGFEEQSQFRMLQRKDIEPLMTKVNATSQHHTVSTITYDQRDAKFLLTKLKLSKVILVNGSWKFVFHARPEYFTLQTAAIPFEHVSPFADEQEAVDYARRFKFDRPKPDGGLEDHEVLALAQDAARESFDYNMQTGVALARKSRDKYELITTTCNTVIPYQSYAMHHGATREIHYSPMHDLNFYDTNHAEVELVVKAQREHIDLSGTTLFINLLPCPTCARMFTLTDIQEFVYREDHSDGYAVKVLEQAGKQVRRLV